MTARKNLQPHHTLERWRKASFSNGGDNCVEVGFSADGQMIGVRDTKDRDGGTFVFARTEWAAFLASAKAGEFDWR